jgi:hypothetical protein
MSLATDDACLSPPTMHAYAADLGASKPLHRRIQSPRFGLVDLDTGEINDI